MDKNDYDNLTFLLTISPETLVDWYNQASDDDRLYALEILKEALTNIDMLVASKLDEVTDVDLARDVLNKFR